MLVVLLGWANIDAHASHPFFPLLARQAAHVVNLIKLIHNLDTDQSLDDILKRLDKIQARVYK